MDETSTSPQALGVRVSRSAEGGVVTLELTGDLDRGGTRRLLAAVALARRMAARTLVIDASDLTFVDVGGYRGLALASRRPSGGPLLHVVLVRGPALRRLQHLLAHRDLAVPAAA
jgi:hypothetical protein